MVYNSEENSVNCSRKRVTDMPQCSRVTLPLEVDRKAEAEIFVRSERYMETFVKYKEKHCNSQGSQRSNLTHNQRQGLSKLKKRAM